MSSDPRNPQFKQFFEDEWAEIDHSTISHPTTDIAAGSRTRDRSNSLASLVKADLTETENGYCIDAELPGVLADDVEVYLEGRALVIKAQRKHIHDPDSTKVHSIQRYYGDMVRTITVPDNANGAAFTKSYKNGVLTVLIPKIPSVNADNQGSK